MWARDSPPRAICRAVDARATSSRFIPRSRARYVRYAHTRAPPHGRADVRARLLAARDVIQAGDSIAVGSFAVACAKKNIRSEYFVEK